MFAGVLAVLVLVVSACSSSARRAPTASGSSSSTTSMPSGASTSSSVVVPSTDAPATTAAAPPAGSPGSGGAGGHPYAGTLPAGGIDPDAVPADPELASCPPTGPRAGPRPDRPVYRLSARLDLAAGVVEGSETVRFTPDLDTDRLVFRLWANAPRIARAGGGIRVLASDPQGFEQPDATTLVRPGALRAGVPVDVSLSWRLSLPTSGTDDRIARAGDAVRLGSFFPILAWEPGVGWDTEPPTSGFAEASVSVPSDFDVSFAVPDGLGVLATGVSDGPGHWVASAVGDWAVSVGHFTTASATAVGGRVQVTVGVDSQVAESPGGYLAKITAAIDRYSALYGTYPWPSFTMAVEPALRGGIEYPMHVMQGPGTGGRTTAHEVGHMWFFGMVPNDQARDPWIDEGLATWLEGRFEGTTASLLAESIPPDGQGRAGMPMTYWEPRQSIYYRSVYVQGTQAVGALGPVAVVDCALRHLVARQAYQVTTDAAVVAALSEVVPNAADVLARYGIPPH